MSNHKSSGFSLKRVFSPNVLKIIVIILAALAQFAIVIIPSLYLNRVFPHFITVLQIISLIVILYLVESDINPVYKLPWIITLLVTPVFGGVLYLTYGKANFAKREHRRFEKIAVANKNALATRTYRNERLREIDYGISVQADYLLRYADAPVYRNTTVKYYPLGEDMFADMLLELEKAEKFIFMEYFIIEEGVMFDSIVEILEKKAQEGIDVRLIYDSFGSIMKAPVDIVRKLEKKGIRCYEFNSFITVLDSRYNNRDHRKICVIDGNVGFTGGINLADEYINKREVYGHWKDTAIKLTGEAVWGLTVMFLSLWDVSCDETDEFISYAPTREFFYDDGFVVPYTDYPLDGEHVAQNVYLNMINRAKKYVYIMTPYLVLDTVMISSLVNAAKSGIDVRIIMPGIPDKKIVYMLSQSYYDVLLKAGVRIFEYEPGFVHAKVFLSDDETAVVGTVNLDYRSLTHHFENAVWMYATECLKDIKKDYMDTLIKCNEVFKGDKKETLIRRLLMPVLRLFSPMF